MGGNRPQHAGVHRLVSGLLWTGSVVLVVSAVIAAIAAITETQAPQGDSRASGLVGAAIFLIVGLALGALARRHGHHSGAGPSGLPFSEHLGSGHSFSSTDALASSIGLSGTASGVSGTDPATVMIDTHTGQPLTAPPAAEARRSRRRTSRRTHKPLTRRGALVQAGIWSLVVVAAIVLAIIEYGHDERSSYTQSHGVADRALIASVDNTQHCGRSGCYYTFAAPVTLATAVGGTAASTVHGRGYWSAQAGQTAEIRVDPKDPSYAELVGSRLDASGTWIILAAIAAFFAAIAGLLLRVYFRMAPSRV